MKEVICSKCNYVGVAGKKKRGSTRVEFGMWMMFPLGLPYTLWRMASKYPVCRHCGNDMLIEIDSPIGRKIMAKLEAEDAEILSPETSAKNIPSIASVVPEVTPQPTETPKPHDPLASRPPVDPDAW